MEALTESLAWQAVQAHNHSMIGLQMRQLKLQTCEYLVVAEVGLEPTRPKAQHFECCVSTNSTTRPLGRGVIIGKSRQDAQLV